jgi:hypothetical protein
MGVSIHTFTLPEDRCLQLLVKILGRCMPESVDRPELKALNIYVQGVIDLRSCRRDEDASKDRLLTYTSLYPWREVSKCPRCDVSLNSAVC